MADLGIARMSNETGWGGTLTRADLADVVPNGRIYSGRRRWPTWASHG